MSVFENAKICFIAWGVPLMIVVTVHWFTPNPNSPKEKYPAAEFTPSAIEVVEKKISKGRDCFELWLRNPNGEGYFIRDPEPGPIQDTYKRIPPNTRLQIRYNPTEEGNTLLEINAQKLDQSILSFADVMSRYATRRRVVHIVAGVWLVLGTAFWIALARVKLADVNDNTKPGSNSV